MVRSGRVRLALFLFVFGFLGFVRPAWSGDGDKPGSTGNHTVAVPADKPADAPAASPPLTAVQIKELRIGVKVETLLHRLGISVAQDIDAQPPQEQRAVERIQQTMQQIVTEYQNAGAPKTMVARVRESLAHIGWRPLVHHLVAPIRNMGSSVTAQGACVSMFSHFIVVPISLALGYHMVAAAAMVPVWAPGYIALRGGISLVPKVIRQRELYAIYGGKKEYKEAMKAEFDMLKQMKMSDLADVLIPLVGPDGVKGEGLAVTPTPGRIKWLLQTLGLRKKGLTFETLARFLKKRGFDPDSIAALRAEKRLPDEYKAVFLLGHVAAKNDEALNADLRAKFASNLVKLADLPQDRWGLRPWAEKFANVRSGADVRALLQEVPPGVPVSVMARLWDEILLPEIAENLPALSMDDLPRLKHQFAPLRRQAVEAKDEPWSLKWETSFADYFNSKVSPPGKCDAYCSLADAIPQ